LHERQVAAAARHKDIVSTDKAQWQARTIKYTKTSASDIYSGRQNTMQKNKKQKLSWQAASKQASSVRQIAAS